MKKNIKLKNNILISELAIGYSKILDLNSIGDISTGKVIQVNWYPTKNGGQINGPTDSDGLVFTFCPNPRYVYQLSYTGNTPVRLFSRAKYQDIWYEWKELLLKEESDRKSVV